MIVEALINLKDLGQYVPGNIITIQPINFNWAWGDLMGRVVIQLELPDLPCGDGFMRKIRCSQCEHQGIAWKNETLTPGDTAPPKVTCPKEKYTAPDGEFLFYLDPKGNPKIKFELFKKRRAKLDILAVLSPESVTEYLKECKPEDVDLKGKLLLSRKPSNLVTTDVLEVKDDITC